MGSNPLGGVEENHDRRFRVVETAGKRIMLLLTDAFRVVGHALGRAIAARAFLWHYRKLVYKSICYVTLSCWLGVLQGKNGIFMEYFFHDIFGSVYSYENRYSVYASA